MPHEMDHDPNAGYHGNDPILKARHESASFNDLWLKSKQKMKPIQAIGFTILNLFIVAGGFFFAQDLRGMFHENIFIGCFMTALSAAFLYLGMRGLVSVYNSL